MQNRCKYMVIISTNPMNHTIIMKKCLLESKCQRLLNVVRIQLPINLLTARFQHFPQYANIQQPGII